MEYPTKSCGICSKRKLLTEFVPVGVNNLFQTEEVSPVCYDCICERVEFNNLDKVDKLCQFLDIPFLANEWLVEYRKSDNKRVVLEAYLKKCAKEEYVGVSWKEYNRIWEKAIETDTVMEKLPSLSADLSFYLKKKWGSYDDFKTEDYIKMEAYEKNTLNYYNFRDEARRDMIRKLALVSVLIDKKLATGDTKEVATLISSYQSLMRESGIQNAVHNDTETIESLSELMTFLEENNWLMDYKVTESRDVVDATIRNFQQYISSLVTGSGEEITQLYNAKLVEENSGTEISEEEIESMFESEESDKEQFEDEALSEEELIEMFKQIGKAYDKNKS